MAVCFFFSSLEEDEEEEDFDDDLTYRKTVTTSAIAGENSIQTFGFEGTVAVAATLGLATWTVAET